MTEETKKTLMDYMVVGYVKRKYDLTEDVSFELKSLTMQEQLEAHTAVASEKTLPSVVSIPMLELELLSRALVCFGDIEFNMKKPEEAKKFLSSKGMALFDYIAKCYSKMAIELKDMVAESETDFFGTPPSLND